MNIQQNLNVILCKDKTKGALARYYHGSLHPPVQFIWIQAVKITNWQVFDDYGSIWQKQLLFIIATPKVNSTKKGKIYSLQNHKNIYEEELKVIKDTVSKIKKKMSEGELFCEALKVDIFNDDFPISDEH